MEAHRVFRFDEIEVELRLALEIQCGRELLVGLADGFAGAGQVNTWKFSLTLLRVCIPHWSEETGESATVRTDRKRSEQKGYPDRDVRLRAQFKLLSGHVRPRDEQNHREQLTADPFRSGCWAFNPSFQSSPAPETRF